MPTPKRARRLRLLFLGLAGAPSALSAAACSDDSIRASDFHVDACAGSPLDGVTPAVPVDYLELRGDIQSGDSTSDTMHVIASHGTRCASASDTTKCEAALSALRPTDLQSPKSLGFTDFRYLVFTRGDEVGAVTSIAALKTFLAPFETPKDGALLLEEFSEHRVNCGSSNARASGDAFEFYTSTGHACGAGAHRDDNIVRIARDGTLTVVETEVEEEGDPNCVIGRLPEGWRRRPAPRGVDPSSSRSVGDYLASCAELEAVSIHAFRRLARELRAHGAPTGLVARARRAARDEIRHTRTTRRLATRFGGTSPRPRVGALPVRSLDAIAEENAREGCARETFGALLATVQASRATDAAVRGEMSVIAREETEHAALAWDVAAWLDRVMDDDARAKTRRARESAVAELHASLGRAFASPLLGLPEPVEARVLLTRMESALREAGGFTDASGGDGRRRERA